MSETRLALVTSHSVECDCAACVDQFEAECPEDELDSCEICDDLTVLGAPCQNCGWYNAL